MLQRMKFPACPRSVIRGSLVTRPKKLVDNSLNDENDEAPSGCQASESWYRMRGHTILIDSSLKTKLSTTTQHSQAPTTKTQIWSPRFLAKKRKKGHTLYSGLCLINFLFHQAADHLSRVLHSKQKRYRKQSQPQYQSDNPHLVNNRIGSSSLFKS